MRAWRLAYRRIRWANRRTAAARVRLVKVALLRPLRAMLDAREALRSPDAAVAAASGVSRLRQGAQLWWLRVVHGVEWPTYYQQRLFHPERWPRARGVVRENELRELVYAVQRRTPSPDRGVFSDKRRFEAWCAEHALPTVSALVEIENGVTVRGGVESLPAVGLFSKLGDGFGGAGARRWRWTGAGYAAGDGAVVDGAGLLAAAAAQSAATGHPMLIQRALDTHPAVADLTTGALATVRFITVRGADDAARPLLAVFRMPSGGAMIDAFSIGGLASRVDLATGALAPAVRKKTVASGATYDAHPDTGGRIAGRVLPCWAQAVALCVGAHQRARAPIPIIGWDVALTADGPVLVEGNIPPSVGLSQVVSGVPLGETELVPVVLELLGAPGGA